MFNYFELTLFTILMYFSTINLAHSYIDLSMIAVFFQMIFAGIIAALLTVKLWYKKVKDYFSMKIKKFFKK
tara:strand:+ start:419 stop:631 length:213 start_codon:yes stop_codon:yes gene_type:complete